MRLRGSELLRPNLVVASETAGGRLVSPRPIRRVYPSGIVGVTPCVTPSGTVVVAPPVQLVHGGAVSYAVGAYDESSVER